MSATSTIQAQVDTHRRVQASVHPAQCTNVFGQTSSPLPVLFVGRNIAVENNLVNGTS